MPLALLATMVVLGLLLEVFFLGGARWLAKIPLVALLAWLGVRRLGSDRR